VAGLRILFLDSWLRDRSRGSGSAVAISGLAGGLELLGHEVTELRPDRVFPSLDLTRLLYNAGLGRRLAGYDPNLVVGFDFDGCLLNRSAIRAPYVVALKGVMADEARFETGASLRRFRMLAPLEARNVRSADAVICTSVYSAGQAARAYGIQPERIRVVPEGIDVSAWSSVAAQAVELRARGDKQTTILSVARQYRRKNTASLLRAFGRLLDSRPDVRLRLVGEGPELARLRALSDQLRLGESVQFVGSVEGIEALQREYAAADVFCLPSLQEGFGIVWLEAMAAGLPIVAARAGATPEVAPHEEVSLLVAPDDDAALAEALDRLLADDGLRRKLGEAGARRWRSYDWSSVARRFLSACLSADL
jgi:glycosyltransferase involved in cell wall biosynthesis